MGCDAIRMPGRRGSNHPPSPDGFGAPRRAEDRIQQAVSLSVISYSLFGKSVAMSCLDDFYAFYGFYGFNDFYGFYDFYDLTNSLIL